MADFSDRSLGIGYAGGSAILLGCVVSMLALWRWREGSVSVNTVAAPRVEVFYWATITFSQTLGTAAIDSHRIRAYAAFAVWNNTRALRPPSASEDPRTIEAPCRTAISFAMARPKPLPVTMVSRRR